MWSDCFTQNLILGSVIDFGYFQNVIDVHHFVLILYDNLCNLFFKFTEGFAIKNVKRCFTQNLILGSVNEYEHGFCDFIVVFVFVFDSVFDFILVSDFVFDFVLEFDIVFEFVFVCDFVFDFMFVSDFVFDFVKSCSFTISCSRSRSFYILISFSNSCFDFVFELVTF